MVMVLDSLGGEKQSAVTNIRQYLTQEWIAKLGTEDQPDFSARSMKTMRPSPSLQDNFSDCGIFLLHYVEKILQRLCLNASLIPK